MNQQEFFVFLRTEREEQTKVKDLVNDIMNVSFLDLRTAEKLTNEVTERLESTTKRLNECVKVADKFVQEGRIMELLALKNCVNAWQGILLDSESKLRIKLKVGDAFVTVLSEYLAH